jgi:nitroreductase
MFNKPIDTGRPIHELVASRWSGRAYDPDRPVTRDQLLSIFEAARWAPSCYGDQPWRFVFWSRHDDEATWARAQACLATGNREWAAAAPVLILTLADTRFRHNDTLNRWAQYDTGAAVMNLCLQAASFGLMSHQMGGFDAEAARQEFGIPDRYTPMAMLALGYQLPEERMRSEVAARERSPRVRRPLAELVSEREWARCPTGFSAGSG